MALKRQECGRRANARFLAITFNVALKSSALGHFAPPNSFPHRTNGGSDAFSGRKRSLSEILLSEGFIGAASVDVQAGRAPGHEKLDDQGSEGGSCVGA